MSCKECTWRTQKAAQTGRNPATIPRKDPAISHAAVADGHTGQLYHDGHISQRPKPLLAVSTASSNSLYPLTNHLHAPIQDWIWKGCYFLTDQKSTASTLRRKGLSCMLCGWGLRSEPPGGPSTSCPSPSSQSGFTGRTQPHHIIRQKILRVTIKSLSSVFPIEHRTDEISRKADPLGPPMLCRELPSDHLPARSRDITGLFPWVYQARIGTITHKWLAFCPLLQSLCNAASKEAVNTPGERKGCHPWRVFLSEEPLAGGRYFSVQEILGLLLPPLRSPESCLRWRSQTLALHPAPGTTSSSHQAPRAGHRHQENSRYRENPARNPSQQKQNKAGPAEGPVPKKGLLSPKQAQVTCASSAAPSLLAAFLVM